MNFYTKIITALIILLLFMFFGCDNPKGVKKPNFIIIFTDDLGYGDLASYGHPTISTPNLDKMASEGMRFTQFYAGSSICTPSRAALLTGKLPIQSGMYGNRSVLFPDNAGGLDPSEKTISSSLKVLGYKTACVGKWHLGHLNNYMPLNHGFDEFYGIPYSNDMRPQSNWKYARENFPPLPFLDGHDTIGVNIDQSNFIQMFTKRSITFIKKNKNNPFFLYLAHSAPHTPLMVKEEYKGKSKRGLYGDIVEELDASVGNILETLKNLKIEDKTFVIFTSDNGPWGWANIDGGSSGLLKGNKGSVYEGGYRVPAIAWMPGTIPELTTTALASTLDFFPTMISLAGGKYDKKSLDGQDLTKTFFENIPIRTDIHYYRQDTLIALRHNQWKIYIKDPDPWNDEFTHEDIPLLYNMDQDPSEKYNIAKENSEIVKSLQNLSIEHIRSVPKKSSKYDAIIPSFQSAYDQYDKKL